MSALLRRPGTARRVTVAAAALATLLSAGCAAGRHAQTADQSPSIDGTNATIGHIDIRAVAIKPPPNGIEYPTGQLAELTMVFINTGTDPQQNDRLIKITSPDASGWGVYRNIAAATAAAAEADGAAASETSPAGVTPSASGGTTAASAVAGSTTAAGAVPGSATAAGASDTTPANGGTTAATGSEAAAGGTAASATSIPPRAPSTVSLPYGESVPYGIGNNGSVLVLTNTTAELHPAQSVPITFTFARAGTVTVQVPIQLADNAPTSIVPSVSAENEG